MSNIIDLRLKLRHWFRKNGKIVSIALIVFGIIFIINRYLMHVDARKGPETTYDPQVSIIDQGNSAPSKVQQTAETMIEEYVGYCNDGNYQKAFNMLSKDCQKYGFNDSIEEFASHVLKKMLTPKNYSIQDYSNYKGYYIYEVKYIDDILATGLTNQTYNYATEKISFKKNKDGSYDMLVGNFISYDKVNNISENDYIKIDVIDRIVNYSTETYKVKFTNRSDNTVVVTDNIGKGDIKLALSKEYRNNKNVNDTIILEPGESETHELLFPKFFDDGDISKSLLFDNIRAIENYKGEYGTEEEQQNEINNPLSEFSVEIPVN